MGPSARDIGPPGDPAPAAAPATRPEGPRGDAYGVVIGINAYADASIPRLRFARADAEALAGVLRDPAVGRFPTEQVTLLVDEAATTQAIRAAVDAVSRRAGPDDTVVLFFAGHGAPLPARGGGGDGMEKFLVPYDARADALRATAISMSEVQQFMSWLDSRRVVVFLDCCYSGDAAGAGVVARGFQPPGLATRALLTDDYLDQVGGDGRLVVTACSASQVSLEQETLGHGVFTYYLLQGLQGEADRDHATGRVTVDQLYTYVSDAVRRAARAAGGAMAPTRTGSVSGDVLLTWYESPTQRRQRALIEDARAATARGDLDGGEQQWREVLRVEPANAVATAALAALAARRAALDPAERVLYAHYDGGRLDGAAYNAAVTLLRRDPDALSARDARWLRLVKDLVAGAFTPAFYLHQLERLDATPPSPPVDTPEPPPQPDAAPTDDSVRAAAIAREIADAAPAQEAARRRSAEGFARLVAQVDAGGPTRAPGTPNAFRAPAPAPVPAQPSAALGPAQVVVGVPVQNAAGFGMAPGIGVRIPGSVQNAIGATLQVVVRFMFPNGALLVAHPMERTYRDVAGYVATGTSPVPVQVPTFDVFGFALGIPFFALNLQPTGGAICYGLSAIASVYVNDVLVAQSPPAPFQVWL